MSSIANALPEVANQYEAMPYLPCDPEDDRRRLARTWLEDLPMINHYCFAGRQSFSGFRVLAAGGGTGDATIFPAEQLRELHAQIVHLDLGCFDYINCSGVLHHLEDPDAGLRKLRADWKGAGQAPDNALLFDDFAESYDTLDALERLLLKHPSSLPMPAGA